MNEFEEAIIKSNFAKFNIKDFIHSNHALGKSFGDNDFFYTFIYKDIPFCGAFYLKLIEDRERTIEDIVVALQKSISREIDLIESEIFNFSNSEDCNSDYFCELLLTNSYLMYSFCNNENESDKLSANDFFQIILDNYELSKGFNLDRLSNFNFILKKLDREGLILDKRLSLHLQNPKLPNIQLTNINSYIKDRHGIK